MGLIRAASLIASACLSATVALVPAAAHQGDENTLEDNIRCAVLLSSWAGYLVGRNKANASANFDPDEVFLVMRSGFAFSLIAIDESNQLGQSTDLFRTRYRAAVERLGEHISPDRGIEAIEVYYTDGMARCAILRASNSEVFEAKLPLVENLFAQELAKVRSDAGP